MAPCIPRACCAASVEFAKRRRSTSSGSTAPCAFMAYPTGSSTQQQNRTGYSYSTRRRASCSKRSRRRGLYYEGRLEGHHGKDRDDRRPPLRDLDREARVLDQDGAGAKWLVLGVSAVQGPKKTVSKPRGCDRRRATRNHGAARDVSACLTRQRLAAT